MPRLGQHFLKNKSLQRKIAGALELAGGDIVVEIGAGHGELTEEIVARTGDGSKAAASSNGSKAKIICLEKDQALVASLKEKFAQIPAVEIHEGDALAILPELADKWAQKNITPSWKITGNIPYYITGKLLRIISELSSKPDLAVLMLQREVAERICSSAPDMNRLAASVQFWADVRISFGVSKENFSPAPKVDSSVIVLRTKNAMPNISSDRYYETVRILFAQPRKTIENNLFAAMQSRARAAHVLAEANIIPGGRPQDLSVDQIVDIAKNIRFSGDNRDIL